MAWEGNTYASQVSLLGGLPSCGPDGKVKAFPGDLASGKQAILFGMGELWHGGVCPQKLMLVARSISISLGPRTRPRVSGC